MEVAEGVVLEVEEDTAFQMAETVMETYSQAKVQEPQGNVILVFSPYHRDKHHCHKAHLLVHLYHLEVPLCHL